MDEQVLYWGKKKETIKYGQHYQEKKNVYPLK